MKALFDWFASIQFSWSSVVEWGVVGLAGIGLFAAWRFWHGMYRFVRYGFHSLGFWEVARASVATLLILVTGGFWIDAVLLLEPFTHDQRLGLVIVSAIVNVATVVWLSVEWETNLDRMKQEVSERHWDTVRLRHAELQAEADAAAAAEAVADAELRASAESLLAAQSTSEHMAGEPSSEGGRGGSVVAAPLAVEDAGAALLGKARI